MVRKMKNIDEITKQLEDGVKDLFESDNYKNYLDVMGKFYNYSFNNCLLIAMQKPDATLIAGYKSWQNDFKRQVKKGEKAIKILAPIPHKYKKEVEDKDGNVEEKEIKWTSFKAVSVFDISQTEGEELPTICNKLNHDVKDYKKILEGIESVSPVGIEYKDIEGEANGYYSHETNSIVVKKEMSETQTLKTLIHEIAHSILHNKDNGVEKGADRFTKEIQAESVAYIVCNNLGIDTSDYSFGYIVGWSKGKEMKELSDSMDVIRDTAKDIIESLQKNTKK